MSLCRHTKCPKGVNNGVCQMSNQSSRERHANICEFASMRFQWHIISIHELDLVSIDGFHERKERAKRASNFGPVLLLKSRRKYGMSLCRHTKCPKGVNNGVYQMSNQSSRERHANICKFASMRFQWHIISIHELDLVSIDGFHERKERAKRASNFGPVLLLCGLGRESPLGKKSTVMLSKY